MNPIQKKIFKIKFWNFITFFIFISGMITAFILELDISIYDSDGKLQFIKNAYHNEIMIFISTALFGLYVSYTAYTHRAVICILYNQMDPITASIVYTQVYKKSRRKFKMHFLSLTRFYSGDFAESFQMSQSILESDFHYEKEALFNIALCYYFSGDFSSASFYVNKVIEYCKSDKKKYKHKQIKEMAYLVKYLIENDPTAIPTAIEILTYGKADYKVNLLLEKFLLAQAYYNQAIYDESKKLLTEVASEGNKIFLVDRANELLQKIETN